MSMNHQTINSKPFPLKNSQLIRENQKQKVELTNIISRKKDCKIKLMKFTLQEENLLTKERRQC